jgi:hypothetical protein
MCSLTLVLADASLEVSACGEPLDVEPSALLRCCGIIRERG